MMFDYGWRSHKITWLCTELMQQHCATCRIKVGEGYEVEQKRDEEGVEALY